MKFCFWGNIAGAISGQTIGGGELQISLLARALATKGHEVVVIDPHIDKSFTSPEGIRVLHVANWNKGMAGLRLFLYRIPALYKMMVKEKADYYYVRMRIYLHLISFIAAKKAKGKFLIALASDIDPMSFRKKLKYEYKANFNIFKYFTQWLPNDIIFRYLVKRADFVIRQHSGQHIEWKKKRGKIVTFPNIVNINDLPVAENVAKDYFIYAGSLTILKGAEILYEIVKNLSGEINILIVGQPNDLKAVPVFDKLRTISNGSVKGRLTHKETLQLIANAKGLINTSSFEGFPNVFLEAWGMGVPVLSLNVNPGNVFSYNGLGSCFDGDIKRMMFEMKKNSKEQIDKSKLIGYVKKYHDFSTAADRFVNLFRNAG